MKQNDSNWLRLTAFFIALLTIDRITKYWALQKLALQSIAITSFLNLELVFNTGISWGMLQSNSQTLYHLITFFIAAIIIGLSVFMYRSYRKRQSVWPHVTILAGAVSNLFDRIYYQGVIDFILVSYRAWSFPVFNIADCYIVVGVFIMAYIMHMMPYE